MATTSEGPILLIEPMEGLFHLNLSSLWQQRELLYLAYASSACPPAAPPHRDKPSFTRCGTRSTSLNCCFSRKTLRQSSLPHCLCQEPLKSRS